MQTSEIIQELQSMRRSLGLREPDVRHGLQSLALRLDQEQKISEVEEFLATLKGENPPFDIAGALRTLADSMEPF